MRHVDPLCYLASLDPAPPKAADDFTKRFARALWLLLCNVAAVLALFLLLEGAASMYDAFRNASAQRAGDRDSLRIFAASGVPTQYDPDLGWTSRPNIYFPNFYGVGKFLKTNTQRFRNAVDFPKAVPPGRVRVICSGDSMTFGLGVDNQHTWPQLLASQALDLEAVNMGQAGYGADQAYLWYKRDGVKIDHDIHILALIYPDLYRMQQPAFNGYAKPVLSVDQGRVVVSNVPVPHAMEFWAPRLVRLKAALSDLAISRLLRRALSLNAVEAIVPSTERNRETSAVLASVLDDLVAMNRMKGSVFVLAYLPIQQELGSKSMGYWRSVLGQYAGRHGILYIDLSDDFRRLPAGDSDNLFIANALGAQGAAGHYNEAGNAFVANLIYQRLLANPETAAKLNHR